MSTQSITEPHHYRAGFLNAITAVDDVNRLADGIRQSVGPLKRAVAVALLADVVESYNIAAPDEPFWEWICDPDNVTISLPTDSKDNGPREEALAAACRLINTLSGTSTWNSHEAAEVMTEQLHSFAVINNDHELANVEAYAIKSNGLIGFRDKR